MKFYFLTVYYKMPRKQSGSGCGCGRGRGGSCKCGKNMAGGSPASSLVMSHVKTGAECDAAPNYSQAGSAILPDGAFYQTSGGGRRRRRKSRSLRKTRKNKTKSRRSRRRSRRA
jgi:hypothetical protein